MVPTLQRRQESSVKAREQEALHGPGMEGTCSKKCTVLAAPAVTAQLPQDPSHQRAGPGADQGLTQGGPVRRGEVGDSATSQGLLVLLTPETTPLILTEPHGSNSNQIQKTNQTTKTHPGNNRIADRHPE